MTIPFISIRALPHVPYFPRAGYIYLSKTIAVLRSEQSEASEVK
jgi:hypothetical protein